MSVALLPIDSSRSAFWKGRERQLGIDIVAGIVGIPNHEVSQPLESNAVSGGFKGTDSARMMASSHPEIDVNPSAGHAWFNKTYT